MPDYAIMITHWGKPDSEPHTIDLADDAAAWEEATTAAGEMLRDLDGRMKPGHEWAIEVRRETGEVLYRVRVNAEAPGK